MPAGGRRQGRQRRGGDGGEAVSTLLRASRGTLKRQGCLSTSLSSPQPGVQIVYRVPCWKASCMNRHLGKATTAYFIKALKSSDGRSGGGMQIWIKLMAIMG